MAYKYFSGNWQAYVEYNVKTKSQDRVSNLTTATVDVYIGNDPGGYEIDFPNTYEAYFNVRIAGITKWLYIGSLYIAGSKKYLGSLEFTFPNDDDGAATRNVEVWSVGTGDIAYGGWVLGSVSASTSVDFPKIPRMSQIASVSGGRRLGSEVTVTLDKKVESFTHQVWYKVWGSDWIDLGTGLGTTVTFTPAVEHAARNINAMNGTLDLCIRTYDGTNQIGSDVYKYGYDIGLPAGTQPKLAGIELIDKAKTTKDIVGKNIFVQTFSEMVCKFLGFEGTYGSTLKGYYAEVVGQKNVITKDGAAFNIFKNHGNFEVRAYITDSRGLTSNVVTVPIQVLQYFAPVIDFSVVRSGGDLQTLTVRRNVRIAPLIVNGVQKNTMKLKFQVKPANDGYFSDNAGGGITSSTVHTLTNSNADLVGKFSAASSWEVHGIISDAYTEAKFTAPIVGPERVVMCKAPEGVGINKVWERGALDVGGDIYSNGELVQVGKLTQTNGKSMKITGSANDLRKTGLFYSHGMSDLPPNLTGSQLYGYIQVNTHPNDEDYFLQTYTPYDANVIYMRRKTPGTGWHPWVQFTPSDVPTKPVWTNASLKSGWRHAADYGNVQFSKSVDGTVYCRGSATGGNTTGETVVFTLPEGYRPEKQLYLTALNNSYGIAIIAVRPNGDIVIKSNADSQWLNFDNVNFRI